MLKIEHPVTCLAKLPYAYAQLCIRVTIFSTYCNFRPVSNFTESHSLTLAACPLRSWLLLYKHVALQCTGLTCSGCIYPHIDALKNSTGIKYLTVEDSCFGSPMVTVEKYCSRMRRYISVNPSSVVWSSINIWDTNSIRKVPVSSWWWERKTAGSVGSCTDQSSTISSNIRDGHNTVVGILHIVQGEPNTCSMWQTQDVRHRHSRWL